MLKKFVQWFGLDQNINHGTKKKKRLEGQSIDREYDGGSSISMDFNPQSKVFYVRIVHPGGRQELYHNSIPASQVMEKYEGMCISRPGVFKKPHESLLKPDEYLLPGQKYYIIPCSTAEKLKCKHRDHAEKDKVGGYDSYEGGKEEEVLDEKIMNHGGEGGSIMKCDSYSSNKEFNFSKERWSSNLLRKGIKGKKPFKPPISKARSCRGVGWEPSLISIQELSP